MTWDSKPSKVHRLYEPVENGDLWEKKVVPGRIRYRNVRLEELYNISQNRVLKSFRLRVIKPTMQTLA